MFMLKFISTIELNWRKAQGCYREFGLLETIQRTFRELTRIVSTSRDQLDISPIAENLAIGASPKSSNAIRRLGDLKFTHVIDLRAERKNRDILINTKDLCVRWIPIYDDWRPKSARFFQQLVAEITKVLSSEDCVRLLLCCGAGEHRAPLAGVLALVTIGYSLDAAISRVKKARPVAELLPVYISSIVEFLEGNYLPAYSLSTCSGLTSRQLGVGSKKSPGSRQDAGSWMHQINKK
jgi:hypothetical protein